MIKFKKYLFVLLFIFLSVFSLSCKKNDENTNKYNLREVYIHTEVQNNYFNDNYEYYYKYTVNDVDLTGPNPIRISWDDCGSSEYKVRLSKSKNLDSFKEYKTSNNYYDLYNLEIKTSYFYQVFDNEKNITDIEGFFVNDSFIRNIKVDGVCNFRDIASVCGTNISNLKQGMLYRSSKFNEDSTNSPDSLIISESGLDVLLNDLKIKSEIDLRGKTTNGIPENGNLTSSLLGENINYCFIPMESASNNILYFNRNYLDDLFDFLSLEDNYPVVFHCSIGTDRTGMVAFLLEVLLGATEDELYFDYLLSNFTNYNITRTSNAIETYISFLGNYKGKTLKDRCMNYLVNELNISKKKIKSFISIMSK